MSQEENLTENAFPQDFKEKEHGIGKTKKKSKTIRVLTVLAYILSVSLAAILLSIYYVFVWDGQPHFGPRIMEDHGGNTTEKYQRMMVNINGTEFSSTSTMSQGEDFEDSTEKSIFYEKLLYKTVDNIIKK